MGRDIIASQTIAQLGGKGLTGALVYMGTKKIIVGKDYIGLHVNGKRGEHWAVKITLDWSDTYTVELLAYKGKKMQVLASRSDVYCDELQKVVEDMYDNGIKEHNQGIIPNVGKIA